MKELFKRAARNPAAVFAAALVLTILSAFVVASRMRMETNLDEYMPKDHPAFVYSDEAEERFMIRDAILIAVEHPETVFNPATLDKVIRIEEDLIAFDEIEEADVRSLHTAENILGTEDGLDVRDFYVEPPADQSEADAVRDAVRANDMVRGRLVSADEKTALILVDLADGSFSSGLYDRILALADKHEGPETIRVAGRPIVEGTMAILGPRDMARMGPLVILVIAAALLVVLRSPLRAIIALAVVLFSTVWTFALMVGLGVPVYTVTIMIPVMLIAIGVAYGIHLYNQIDFYAAEHPEAGREEVAGNVVDVIWNPVLYAGLTTIAGFASLTTSQVYPVKFFGLFAGFGVLAALLLSMLLIPAGIVLFGTGKRRTKKTSGSGTAAPRKGIGSHFADGVLARPKTVVAAALAVVVLASVGVSRVWINSSFLDNFEKSSDIARTDAFMNAHFGGTSTLNAILEAEDADAFKDPALLSLLQEIQTEVLGQAKVGDSISIADYLTRMNKVMHEDRAEFDAIPESADMVAQYLLLYEMSGDPDNLWKVVDNEYRSANLTVQLKSDDSKTIRSVVDFIDSYADRLAEHGVEIRYAGSGYKSMVFSGLILDGQLSSLGLSVLIVFILVAFMFRSLVLGLIGTIPVALSILVNFGAMGLLGLPLTTSTALISSIAVGIGVDYAIHLIERYRERLREGDEPEAAGRFAMSLTGRAVFLNAAIVIAGFLVLLFSVFPPNRQVGALISLNMVTAFAGTVTIMFLVMRKSYVEFKEKRT
jgi:predicted RND superfamily exporter protein